MELPVVPNEVQIVGKVVASAVSTITGHICRFIKYLLCNPCK